MSQPRGAGRSSMQECIENCTECHRVCLETVTHCLQQGGAHAEASHIRLLLDCVQICQTSADFMSRGSELHAQTCGVCADICERCARDCERWGEDPQMKACAEVCRRCATSCHQMSGMARAA
jgi:hypothetical protein